MRTMNTTSPASAPAQAPASQAQATTTKAIETAYTTSSASFGFKAKAAAKIAAANAEAQRRKEAERRALEIIQAVSRESGFDETGFYGDCLGVSNGKARTRAAKQIYNNLFRKVEKSDYLQSIGALEYLKDLEIFEEPDAQLAYIKDFLNTEILDEIDNFVDEDLHLYCKGVALCAALHTEFESFKALEEENEPSTPFIKAMTEKLEEEEHMSYML